MCFFTPIDLSHYSPHRSIKILLLKKMNKIQDILYFVKMCQNNVWIIS